MGIFTKHQRGLAIVLLAIAVLLNLCLTRFATQYTTMYAGYSGTVHGPLSDPILTTNTEEILFACLASCQAGRAGGGAAEVSGFFARDAFPRDLAFWAGIALPCLLLILSGIFAFGLRWMITIATFLLGLLLASATGFELFYEYRFQTYLYEGSSWQIVLVFVSGLILGLALIYGSVWLWRTRSPKQPA